MKPGYLFAELDVQDEKVFFEEYMPRVKPVLKKYGARFVVATNEPQVKEGDRAVKRVILIEFDSLAIARDFYHSNEYQEVAQYRFRSAATHLYLLDGL